MLEVQIYHLSYLSWQCAYPFILVKLGYGAISGFHQSTDNRE